MSDAGRRGRSRPRRPAPVRDLEPFEAGHLTPVFFGSAINEFGVRELLQGLAALGAAAPPQPADKREVEPAERN